MFLGAMSGRNRRCLPQRSTHRHLCHWEKVYVYDTISLDRQLILRQHRMRRGFVLLVMVVILAVPFSLGTVLYRVGSLEAASLLFGISQQSQQSYAYNDRIGREVAPHALWREHGPQWQSPHPGLKVFAAHYRHDLGSLSKPVIRVTALATAGFLYTCFVRARVVYRDYPHSFPTDAVHCKQLSMHPTNASDLNAQPVPVVLRIATGQPADRVPVAVSIQARPSRTSTVWIAVNTVFVDPPDKRDAFVVCLNVDHGAELDHVTILATSYRLQGARQVIAYGSPRNDDDLAFNTSSAQLLPWYNADAVQGVPDVVLTSLMLRDCALRSSARTRCLALLGSEERLVFKAGTTRVRTEGGASSANCCFRNPRFLEVCDKTQAVFLTWWSGDVWPSRANCQPLEAVEGSSTSHDSVLSSKTSALRRCANGTALQAVMFRVDEDLLEERVTLKKALVLPPQLAVLRPITAAGSDVHEKKPTVSNSVW
ncbi:uncharacterized protein LOC144110158 [Amblyomma americanum]